MLYSIPRGALFFPFFYSLAAAFHSEFAGEYGNELTHTKKKKKNEKKLRFNEYLKKSH